MSFAIKDAELKKTWALPNGAATTYATPGIDLGIVTAAGKHLADCEVVLTAPALNTTQQPDAKTLIYSILMDTVDPIDGSSTVLALNVLTQTGAGGAGAAAATWRGRLPSNVSRILGARAIGSASGDASGASATLELVF